MDMNESASLAVAALAMNAETLANFVSAFAATGHYGDGMNLYQYAGGNPANRLDALGLFSLIELTWSSEVVLDESLDSMDRGKQLHGRVSWAGRANPRTKPGTRLFR
jgi:hypothetical protein